MVQHPTWSIWSAQLAPGGDWIAVGGSGSGTDDGGGQFIARLRDGAAAPVPEWLPSRGTHWSPDGNRMYGFDGRDGYPCIWSQRLDPATKRLAGEPEAVCHIHGSRRSPDNAAGRVGLSVAGDKLVFTMGELTGNIWMAQPQPR